MQWLFRYGLRYTNNGRLHWMVVLLLPSGVDGNSRAVRSGTVGIATDAAIIEAGRATSAAALLRGISRVVLSCTNWLVVMRG